MRSCFPHGATLALRICHDAGAKAFMLPLRNQDSRLIDALEEPRLQRTIGSIYRPETELYSHYFRASLPRQFDEYFWIDEATPLPLHEPDS